MTAPTAPDILRHARTLKAAFALEFIDIAEAARTSGAVWEPFQIEFLNHKGRFAEWVKSRQIAWSFTAALDAVTDSIIHPETPHIFVSVNLNEAQEKIRYAKAILQATRPRMRPGLLTDSKTEMEFDNGSRLISHPCKPVLGKAQARIYLDEMAHYPHTLDREIYRGALPATIRGDGYIRIGSSPLGERGLFWEIAVNRDGKFPGYFRRVIPWWHSHALCKDVKLAKQIAPLLSTEERVLAFGRPPLVDIFSNMFLEDFQQEYECAWVDEQAAWIPWDLIKKIQRRDLTHFSADSVDSALSLIPDVKRAIQEGEVEPVLYGGLDVGRVQDLTEFILIGRTPTGQRPMRVRVSLRATPYDDQLTIVREFINRLPIASVLIDQNGIGNMLAETLEQTGRATGIDFTNATKELLAVEAKIQSVRRNALIPLERDLANQIHSVKKRITAAKNAVYDTERNSRHHADAFWAWALALWAAREDGRQTSIPLVQRAAHGGWHKRR